VTKRFRINPDVVILPWPPGTQALESEGAEASQDGPRKRRRPRQPSGDVMTVRQVANQLAVDTATVTGWIRTGQLKASNVGKGLIRPRWRVALGDLKAFLARRQVQADPPAARRRRRTDHGVTQFYT
jgi:excisionase family DNA binding protein